MKSPNHLFLLFVLLFYFPWEAQFLDKNGGIAVVLATTSASAVEPAKTGGGRGASGGAGGGSGNSGGEGGGGNRGGEESGTTGSGSGMPILGSTSSHLPRNKGQSSKHKSGAARSFGYPRFLGLLPLTAVLIY